MNTYSTTLQVRREAGFYGNPNVGDDQIDTIRGQAYATVRGIVAGRYSITDMVPGNTNFDGSQAALLLQRAEILIAAGYLLGQEFGEEQLGEDYDAERKIKQGKDVLLPIFDTKAPIRLIGADGVEFSRVSVATESGEDGIILTMAEGSPAFSVNQVF